MPLVFYVVFQDIAVLVMTETWLGTDTDQITINELVPAGYEFNHIPHKSDRRSRGIGIIY